MTAHRFLKEFRAANDCERAAFAIAPDSPHRFGDGRIMGVLFGAFLFAVFAIK